MAILNGFYIRFGGDKCKVCGKSESWLGYVLDKETCAMYHGKCVQDKNNGAIWAHNKEKYRGEKYKDWFCEKTTMVLNNGAYFDIKKDKWIGDIDG